MKKVAITELDPRLQKQIAAADQQLKTNPQYAMEILSGILSRNPGCLEVRRSLRRSQKAILGVKKGLFDGLLGGNPDKLAEKDPLAAIQAAEDTFAKKPGDIGANKLLAAAALKLDFPELAAFAYEELTQVDAKNVQHFIDLANTWIAAHDYDAALNAADAGLKIFPGNGDLQEAVRKASVSKTMRKGNWEDKGDFQSKLKDKDEALRLEQAARTVTDSGTAIEQAAALAVKIQAQPDSLDLYRDIVRQFIAAGDLDSAIAWLQRGRLTTLGKQDSSLERQEIDLIVQRFEKISKLLTEKVQANPADAAAVAELAKNEGELTAYRLQTTASDESVQQLQYAQRNPKFRQASILAIGKAFVASAKFDLAVDQFNLAKSELQVMNDLKKDVIYELASAFEKMGRTKEAMEEFKAIYMADSGYRDVSKKINAFYESQKGPAS